MGSDRRDIPLTRRPNYNGCDHVYFTLNLNHNPVNPQHGEEQQASMITKRDNNMYLSQLFSDKNDIPA